jgi:hypothetical protein
MIRLGVVDFDTSHAVEFTLRLNHKAKDREQWVDGAEVVLGCPGESRIMPERIPGYKREMGRLGVKLVDRPGEMIGKVDGVLVESQEGGAHWGRARPFLEAGLPCFIDKPFTCGVADAKKILALAARKKVPVFSASALRYAPELVRFTASAGRKKLLGALAYGPAPLYEKDRRLNPGLYHYGIHVVEVLYTLMGPGCQRVVCTHEKDVDVVTGQWKGGRVATVRGEPALDFINTVMPVLNRTPARMATAAMTALNNNAVLTTSSWCGVPHRVYVAGAELTHFFVFGPLPGTNMTAALCTHAGTCCIGVNVDAAVFADTDVLWECLRAGLEEILELGR